MIIKNNKEVKKIYRKEKEVKKVLKRNNLEVFETTFPVDTSAPWWEEYGEIAEYVATPAPDVSFVELDIPVSYYISTDMTLEYLSHEEEHEQIPFGWSVITAALQFGYLDIRGGFKPVIGSPFWPSPSLGITLANNVKYNQVYKVYHSKFEIHLDGNLIATRKTNGIFPETDETDTTIGLFGYTSYFILKSNIKNAHIKLYDLKLADYNKCKMLGIFKPFYVSKKPVIDAGGTEHPVGSYIVVDIYNKVFPKHEGEPLTGQRKL